MYEFLVRFIIAIVFVIAVFWIGKSFFRLTGEGLNSFNEVVGIVQTIQDGELKSTSLVMDKGTAVFAFSKDSDHIGVGATGIITGAYKEAMIIKRPGNCGKGKACMCLCRSDWERKDFTSVTHEMRCVGSLTCHDLENSDILSNIPLTALGLEIKPFYTRFSIKGGLTFERYNKNTLDDVDLLVKESSPLLSFFSPRDDFESLHGSISPIVFDQRLRTIYVERYKNTVGICFSAPCLSQAMKQTIDAG